MEDESKIKKSIKFEDDVIAVNDSNNNITPGVTSFNYLSERERRLANDAKIPVEKYSILKTDAVLQSKTDLIDRSVQEIIKSTSRSKERKLINTLCSDLVSDT